MRVTLIVKLLLAQCLALSDHSIHVNYAALFLVTRAAWMNQRFQVEVIMESMVKS